MTTTMTRAAAVLLAVVALGRHDVAVAAEQRAEGGFERSLTVSGSADLEVRTGSGRIEIRPGNAGRVQITARIVANDGWGSGRGGLSPEERVRRIEANPPVTQSGNRIRIGVPEDDDLLRNVSISYTISVPSDTAVVSRTGSGSIEIEGVRRQVDAHSGSGSIRIRDAGAVKAGTGSGSITAERVGGAFDGSSGSGSIRGSGVAGAITAHTGSGSIEVSQDGSGDVSATSGSGSIVLSGVNGGVQASTGSGTVRVAGRQTADWELASSSGGIVVELAGQPAFTLDARTGGGRIETAYPVAVSGTLERRSLRGPVNGGGPLLHLRTSSGSIRVR
ncbi:MAG: DUF4097 family beta strand repeat-containing protein [Vicinamibacterales bacterium]